MSRPGGSGGAWLAAVAAGLLALAASAPAFAAAGDSADAVPSAGLSAAPSGVAEVTAVRVVGDHERTRFVADLTNSPDIAVFTLADPYRVVIDLPETHFQLPDGTGKSGRGLVSAFRYGLISAGRSRFVLDLTGPVSVDKSFVLPSVEDQPARLVVDVVPTTRQAFLDASRRYREAELAAAAAPKGDREPVDTPDTSDGRLRIVIDPGHGGIDSGARSADGVQEKDVVLAFANTLAEQLSASGRYEVLLTRADDTFIPLRERVAFARRHDADLFISIHADSFRRGETVHGTAVYTLSEQASTEMAAALAESENRSDVLAGLDIPVTDDDQVADILLDLTRRETKNFSIVFARQLVDQLRSQVQLFKHPMQEAGFMVLKAPDVPSALVELGFLSNPEDEAQLRSDQWRQETATAMVGAIDRFFSTRLAQRTP